MLLIMGLLLVVGGLGFSVDSENRLVSFYDTVIQLSRDVKAEINIPIL